MFLHNGPMTNLRSREATIEGRAATRYDIDLDLESLMQGHELPEGQPGKLTYSMWIARDGGYLLRYTGGMPFSAPSPPETIEVTPLEHAPDIEIPTVGQAVFTGNPPPWRAAVIGQIGLSRLESYAFEQSTDLGSFATTASGRVSESCGQIIGTQADTSARAGARMTPGVANLPMVRTELIYIGRKLWARRGDGAWRTVKLRTVGRSGPGEMSEQDAEAFVLLDSIPGGAPGGLRTIYPSAEAAPVSAGVDPLSAMPALQDGALVGKELINGVEALHYRSRVGTAVAGAGSTTDYWLAADGHHMLRARVRMQLGPTVPGTDGSVRISLDVTDVNRPFTVKPPNPRAQPRRRYNRRT